MCSILLVISARVLVQKCKKLAQLHLKEENSKVHLAHSCNLVRKRRIRVSTDMSVPLCRMLVLRSTFAQPRMPCEFQNHKLCIMLWIMAGFVRCAIPSYQGIHPELVRTARPRYTELCCRTRLKRLPCFARSMPLRISNAVDVYAFTTPNATSLTEVAFQSEGDKPYRISVKRHDPKGMLNADQTIIEFPRPNVS